VQKVWEDHSTTFEGETDGETEEEVGDGEDKGGEAMVM
jgi:hypothetical protein